MLVVLCIGILSVRRDCSSSSARCTSTRHRLRVRSATCCRLMNRSLLLLLPLLLHLAQGWKLLLLLHALGNCSCRVPSASLSDMNFKDVEFGMHAAFHFAYSYFVLFLQLLLLPSLFRSSRLLLPPLPLLLASAALAPAPRCPGG